MPATEVLPTGLPQSHNDKIMFGLININNRMIQQKLHTYQPLLTPQYIIILFIVLGIAFIPIGIGILLAAQSISSQTLRYDTLTPTTCISAQPDTCMTTVNMTINENFNGPVYFYYELENYYQNHRRYEQSKSDAQYAADISAITISDCNPLASYDGATIYPCGITANTQFNDTFAASYITSQSDTPIMLGGPTSDVDSSLWQKQGIAWKTDVQTKFVPLSQAQIQQLDYTQIGPNTPAGEQLPSVTNEDWIVWMRVSAFPKFRKLYRIINTDIPAGSILSVNISSVYPVANYNGVKSIVLSTTSWMGGYNIALGWIYITIGIICILVSVAYAIKYWLDPRLVTDIKNFDFTNFHEQAKDAM